MVRHALVFLRFQPNEDISLFVDVVDIAVGLAKLRERLASNDGGSERTCVSASSEVEKSG